LKFPITKLDISFWDSIQDLGVKPDLIKANTKLEDYLKVFSDFSLFHYFAGNIDVIQIIYDKYKEGERNNELECGIELLPLMILNYDHLGKTALDLASEH